jgi:hypothetical protein
VRTASYCLLFTLVLCAPRLAWAQQWAIQAFAFGQTSQADTVVTRLREVGLDAYTSSPRETTLSQVRIGCFGDQQDAEALAQDVRQRVALDAHVVPFVAGDAATVCTARQLGFIPPVAWGIEDASASSVSFWLEAAGRPTITFDGERWTLQQGGGGSLEALEPFEGQDDVLDTLLDPSPAAGLSVRFRATQSRGLPLIRADFAGGSLLVAAGELLWASPRAAVVQEGSDVFALRLYRP